MRKSYISDMEFIMESNKGSLVILLKPYTIIYFKHYEDLYVINTKFFSERIVSI